MDINTHLEADATLLGSPQEIETGVKAKVKLVASEFMKVDERGLVHGGFTFSLADYTAMLAINDPYVVLGESKVRFTAPVVVGETMIASANVVQKEGNRIIIEVKVMVGNKLVLEGSMTCFILEKHVLEKT
jgi:acyl-coenzyme A thioesterase PaaI-like protein